MNYEMHIADFFFFLSLPFPVWRLTQETSGLPRDYFLWKRLSQATCCTTHFMPNSVILHSAQGRAKRRKEKKEKGEIKKEIKRFADGKVEPCLVQEEVLDAFTDHVIADVRKHLKARAGICPSHCQHPISFFPSVPKALRHSSVFITVVLPVSLDGICWRRAPPARFPSTGGYVK